MPAASVPFLGSLNPAAPSRAPASSLAAIDASAAILAPGERLDSDVQELDGRRRRKRMVLGVVALFVVAFGGMFAALAESYTHAHP
ncbi:MAG: hypothetical protein JOZ69_01800 [Myxococcales bacterium]|nr:hypothetical protein [Myxococcales bacterium]